MVRELGMVGAKPVATPGSRDDVGRANLENGFDFTLKEDWWVPEAAPPVVGEENGTDLQGEEATKIRGICARLNYLAQDRPDIRYACKEAGRRMAKPQAGDLLRRIARYLRGKPRGMERFEWQDETDTLDTYVDSDWAGCKKSCKNTSESAVMKGAHSIMTWSSTQAVIERQSSTA